MKRFPGSKKLFEKFKELTNINEDCSDTNSSNNNLDISCVENKTDFLDFEEDDDEIEVRDIEQSDEYEYESEDSGSEYEIPQKSHKRRKRLRICSDTESDSQTETEKRQQKDIALDGTEWEELGNGCVGRLPSHTIFKDTSGPTGYAKRNIMLGSVSSAFRLIIDNRMMSHIKTCTELEARNVLQKNDWEITIEELHAFVAILYARGAYEARNLKLSYLWSEKWGPSFFHETMSRNRFSEIMRFIRFDKKSERSVRLRTDKFGLASEMWKSFIDNSQACYKPDQNISVDEQLFPTKARCRFLQYMPNKPDKFGIKFWLAVDVRSKYLINGFPYLGKDELRPSGVPLNEDVVLNLVKNYMNCGRNITTDNFFTSIQLAKKLLAKKTSLVGTMRANKRELPKIAKVKKDNMALFSTKLYKSNDTVLTIYKSKPRKKVLLLSSKHKSVKIASNRKRTPETVSFYNKTKFGVDVLDQMARKYSVKAGSRRWPLQVFYNILDLAAINAWILYKETCDENITRKQFLFQLAEELSSEYRCCRKEASNQKQERKAMDCTPENSKESPYKRKSCQIRLCNKNRAIYTCNTCNKYVCGKCSSQITCTCKICAS
ncbi:unnamed protein product [Euphydryas editha]|uniref:PiggyBac transposable element-derived protein domain-containing protein n=1 Tax=Euphydryas editha TaxID=104508 RepID=A0AAU9TQ71_EUPED|nr:unnamed protein product [Euphydryas editha]CAH2097538.1 unnamed protein product [Euphydryas editha]